MPTFTCTILADRKLFTSSASLVFVSIALESLLRFLCVPFFFFFFFFFFFSLFVLCLVSSLGSACYSVARRRDGACAAQWSMCCFLRIFFSLFLSVSKIALVREFVIERCLVACSMPWCFTDLIF
jgi:hypothetical protein